MRKFRYIWLLMLIPFALFAAGCDENVSAKSDETVCVFDGSERGSQKLKYQIFPGQEPRHADRDDEIVRIPTSFRFYAAFNDRSIADAGAPEHYLGYAKGNVPIQVQGTARFRFNTDNACEWYARHGRRNAGNNGLGFNARSDEAASSLSPWVRWLNENFGTAMAASIKASSLPYTWPELVYGNDPEVKIERNSPVDISYGRHIGKVFTARLNDSLGGKFFCGTDLAIWKGDETVNQDCPPIFFDVGPIKTNDPALMQAREETEALRAAAVNEELAAKIEQDALRKELENAAIAAQIRANRVGAQLKDEKTKQRLLKAQGATKRLEALATLDIQKCIILAQRGLDCDGKHPVRIVAGQSGR